MNAQDRQDIKELSKEFREYVKEWNDKKESDAAFHATMKLKVKGVQDAKKDHEKRIRVLEKAERKTIVLASLVGAVVTGGGALVIYLLVI